MSAGTPFLHVTNGDGAVGALGAAGFEGEFLPWRDVLHDGPVPAGLSAAELAAVRAVFLADRGWSGFDRAFSSLRERDEQLDRLAVYGETVLWFEHDLYDQLQLIQVLDRIAGMGAGATRITLTNEAAFIGTLEPGRIRRLFESRGPVTRVVLEAGSRAWMAFTAPDPVALSRLAGSAIEGLPFLGAALTRLLEEYPDAGTGLGRTERQLLEAVRAGADTPAGAFQANQAREQAMFLGDASFWQCMGGLLRGVRPLLGWVEEAPATFPPASPGDRSFFDRRLRLTEAGDAVLEGRLDHVAVNGIDRWIGGVRLQPGAVWRYDAADRRLVAPV